MMSFSEFLDQASLAIRVLGTAACIGLLVFGAVPPRKSHDLWFEAWRRLRRNRTALAGYYLIVLLALVAFSADWISPHDPASMDLERAEVCVIYDGEGRHWLGTDLKGRDNLSRLIHGTRISLQVGFVSQLVASTIGITVGLLSGYYGGWLDMLLMRLTDVMLAFPFLLFVLVIVAVLGTPPLWVIFVVIGVVGWPHLARVVRAQVLTLKQREFVEAAHCLGARDTRILLGHLLPNCMAPIIVQVSLGMAQAILSEAGLSFLGFGAKPPLSSWGLMVAQGQEAIDPKWWVSVYPGLAIMVSVYAFNVFGDGLRDALDPRMKT